MFSSESASPVEYSLGAAPFKAVSPRSLPKQKFTEDDDRKLIQLVQQFGTKSWAEVAAAMGNRNQRQCKERWMNYLSPMVRNTPWTPEEDELLKQKVSELGQKWVRIAKFFPMRTDINIKNRYLVLMRRSRKEARSVPPPETDTPFVQITSDVMPPLFIKKSLLPLKKIGVFMPATSAPICPLGAPPKIPPPLNLTSYLRA